MPRGISFVFPTGNKTKIKCVTRLYYRLDVAQDLSIWYLSKQSPVLIVVVGNFNRTHLIPLQSYHQIVKQPAHKFLASQSPSHRNSFVCPKVRETWLLWSSSIYLVYHGSMTIFSHSSWWRCFNNISPFSQRLQRRYSALTCASSGCNVDQGYVLIDRSLSLAK